MSPRRRSHGLLWLVALLLLPRQAGAQDPMLIQNQMAKSITVEVHSVGDDVTMYAGDPQYLFHMQLRPLGTLPPSIVFSNTNQEATLRVLDLSLLEAQKSEVAAEPAAPGDEGEDEPQDEPKRPPVAQEWQIELTPSAPTSFVLHCQHGKGTFDFTDMQATEIYLVGDTTALKVDFSHANPVALPRLKVTANAGKLVVRNLLNAKPKVATLQMTDSDCDIDIGGKAFAGQSEIYFEGVPASARITLPRSIGLRIEGPSATVAHFDAKGLERQGAALQTLGYESQTCRVRLFFSRALPNLEVRWHD